MSDCCNNVVIPVNPCEGTPCRQFYSTDCVLHNGTLACESLGTNPTQTNVNNYFCGTILNLGAQIAALPVLSSGTYIPVITGGINISNISVSDCQYMRVGNTVTVSGIIALATTILGVAAFTMSLPITNLVFTDFYQAAGTATTINAIVGSGYGAFSSNTGSHLVNGVVTVPDTGPYNFSFTLTYQIL